MRPSYDNHAATIALRWPEHADPPAEGPAVYFDAATAWLVGDGELVGGDQYYTTVSVDSGPGWADRLDEEIRGYGFDSVRFML